MTSRATIPTCNDHSSESIPVVAAVLHGPNDLREEIKTLNPPAPFEVQIKITDTGVCGTDLHYFQYGRNGDFQLKHPLTLGHEAAGIVTALGSAVTSFKVGDRVALEVGVSCSECYLCKSGSYNLCPLLRFRGSCKSVPHYDGTLVQKVNHPAQWCHLVPDGIKDLSLAALAEPLAVSLQGIKRSRLETATKKDNVLVLGAGTVGLLTAFAAKKSGAKTVVIADISADRVNFAVASRIADKAVLLSNKKVESTDPLAPAIASAELLKRRAEVPNGFDAVFECTGVQICVQAAILAAAPATKVVLIGMGHPMQELPIGVAGVKEVDIISVFRYANTYKKALDMVDQDGDVLIKMVTHKFPLTYAAKAIETASLPVDRDGKLVLKVMIGD
ncbi:chaperonin 10-like protein [Lipomyces starkeyi]|uniref:Enoyl reductase (ER) domain-containing protein n=1 Tax=Lipomyces starkeyi NRRL Y-11557 TaxID=675824 RepID=A0A1E3Q268_LIPST|nr:hypothetical protein LIPSTDRAFT_338832 [Lipomyces starkeyi NRRL Y-11557]